MLPPLGEEWSSLCILNGSDECRRGNEVGFMVRTERVPDSMKPGSALRKRLVGVAGRVEYSKPFNISQLSVQFQNQFSNVGQCPENVNRLDRFRKARARPSNCGHPKRPLR
jgi:hypothetical protein